MAARAGSFRQRSEPRATGGTGRGRGRRATGAPLKSAGCQLGTWETWFATVVKAAQQKALADECSVRAVHMRQTEGLRYYQIGDKLGISAASA